MLLFITSHPKLFHSFLYAYPLSRKPKNQSLPDEKIWCLAQSIHELKVKEVAQLPLFINLKIRDDVRVGKYFFLTLM